LSTKILHPFFLKTMPSSSKLSTYSKKYSYPEQPAFLTPIFIPTPLPLLSRLDKK
jgi:hypothetical protein